MRSTHLLLLLAFLGGFHGQAFGAEKPNVLFIAVDDLTHWVGHLGRNSQTKTPNIDRLEKMGVTFTRAYCAVPICNPSRTALLSGKRPGVTGVYDNSQPFRQAHTQCRPEISGVVGVDFDRERFKFFPQPRACLAPCFGERDALRAILFTGQRT